MDGLDLEEESNILGKNAKEKGKTKTNWLQSFKHCEI